ncbi:hypothetical protein E8E11_005803 [Didymella keratinophila]|nr:hypothetical protein E8E11_005803 [Didymella keratinophila]
MAHDGPWTHKLKQFCQENNIGEIVFQDVSDRRGGRTAWSTIAVINNIQYPARFWYDGSRMEQAKEDAAEFALGHLEKAHKKQCQSANHYHHSLAAL